jgi:hypothetical protein
LPTFLSDLQTFSMLKKEYSRPFWATFSLDYRSMAN